MHRQAAPGAPTTSSATKRASTAQPGRSGAAQEQADNGQHLAAGAERAQLEAELAAAQELLRTMATRLSTCEEALEALASSAREARARERQRAAASLQAWQIVHPDPVPHGPPALGQRVSGAL